MSSFDQGLFDKVEESDIDRIKDLYRKYCPAILKRNDVDHSFLFMLAFQRKYKVHYLANLVDNFSRYRIEHDDSRITAAEWIRLDDNQHFNQEPLKHVKVAVPGQPNYIAPYGEFAASCMASFSQRCCPPLTVDHVSTLIDDSLEQTANYVSAAADFVSNMAKSAKQAITVPFQFDVAIAVGAPQRYDPGQGNDDNDDGDDAKKADIEQQPEYRDWIRDVKEKLDANKLIYSRSRQSNEDEVDAPKFPNLFKKFLQEHDLQEVDESEKKHYVANKRLIAFVDRRASKKDESVSDDVFIYEPPPGAYTRDIPPGDDFVPDWFMSASRTSILPNTGYNAEVVVGNQGADDTAKPTEPGSVNIASADHCHGGLITFSFCVYGVDQIKLYLYWNGGMIRLLPRDLKLFLPRIFVQSKANKEYTESQELQSLIESMEKILYDKEFADWMDAYPMPQHKE